MPRQQDLAGFERPNGDKELDALAEAFKRSSKKRKKAQDGEIEARSALIEALKKKKITVYEDKNANPPLLVTLTTGDDKVKVIAIDAASGEDDDDGDDENDGPAAAAEEGAQKAKKKSASAEA